MEQILRCTASAPRHQRALIYTGSSPRGGMATATSQHPSIQGGESTYEMEHRATYRRARCYWPGRCLCVACPTTPSSPGESMKTHHRPLVYRIVAAHSWPAEGLRTNTVQREILAASLEGTVVAPGALADVVHCLGAELVSPVAATLSDDVVSGTRFQAVIAWCGHHYDLDLEAVEAIKAPAAMKVPHLLPAIAGRAPNDDVPGADGDGADGTRQ